MVRVIGHLDLDYFYAQVEEVQNPSLKTRPVVVCVFSGRTEDSGVVSTSNYQARALGVRSGLPIVTAKRRLEGHNPAVIRMDHGKYEEVSARVMELVGGKVDAFEKTGIDEAFFDVTAMSKGDYQASMQIAQELKDTILRSEGLTSSVGLGRSKVVAKVASDFAKPDGLTVVTPESTLDFLGVLPVTKLYGVGPKTTTILEEMKVRTVAELAQADPSALERHFGRRLSSYLLAAARGTDEDPVVPNQEPTQFSRIVTLRRDTRDPTEALGQMAEAVASIQGKLIGSGKSYKTLSVIGVLSDLSVKTKSRTLELPARDAAGVRDDALVLLEGLLAATDKSLRRVGIRVSELTDSADQSSLSDFLPSGQ